MSLNTIFNDFHTHSKAVLLTSKNHLLIYLQVELIADSIVRNYRVVV